MCICPVLPFDTMKFEQKASVVLSGADPIDLGRASACRQLAIKTAGSHIIEANLNAFIMVILERSIKNFVSRYFQKCSRYSQILFSSLLIGPSTSPINCHFEKFGRGWFPQTRKWTLLKLPLHGKNAHSTEAAVLLKNWIKGIFYSIELVH